MEFENKGGELYKNWEIMCMMQKILLQLLKLFENLELLKTYNFLKVILQYYLLYHTTKIRFSILYKNFH